MRSELEIQHILEEIGEILGPYREPSEILKLMKLIDNKTKKRVSFVLIAAVTLMWAAGRGVPTSIFLNHFNINRLINIRKTLIKRDNYQIGLLDLVADIKTSLRNIIEIDIVTKDLEQASGTGLEPEELVKFHNTLSLSLRNKRTLCCFALDTLSWLYQEIETEEFRKAEFLGIETLKKQLQEISS